MYGFKCLPVIDLAEHLVTFHDVPDGKLAQECKQYQHTAAEAQAPPPANSFENHRWTKR